MLFYNIVVLNPTKTDAALNDFFVGSGRWKISTPFGSFLTCVSFLHKEPNLPFFFIPGMEPGVFNKPRVRSIIAEKYYILTQ